ncbi:MAG: L-fucose:H+ symporter permease [Bacteroidota bacterium]|nr:L-fucose:H+ symporter permease [Bacteroidota bacterium]
MALAPSQDNNISSNYDPSRNYTIPFAIVTSLFFLWAMGGKMNDILIPHLRKALDLTDFQSSLVQTAFFGAYFFMAIPAGWVMKKTGYKNGIMLGLLFCIAGALLFYPAAESRVFAVFLSALFVMACGFAILEVAANPYVTVLGDSKGASGRLNLAQGFNSLGATITPFIGAQVILSGVEKSESDLASMTPADLDAYKIFEADRVKGPYLVMAAIFLLIIILVYFSKLPEIKSNDENASGEKHSVFGVLKYKHLLLGVLGIFLYVGAQEGIASFIIRFMQYLKIEGVTEKLAANYIVLHWGAFMIGRFIGSYLTTKFDPAKMLSVFAVVNIFLVLIAVTTSGMFAIWCVVGIGFFNSIMFPTIFSLSLQSLGKFTKDGATFLVMAIVGAAIVPPIMGLISTSYNIQMAFIVPAFCYLYVLYYGLRGYRPNTN